MVFDSSANEAGDPAYCEDAQMAVEPGTGGSYLTYSVPISGSPTPPASTP